VKGYWIQLARPRVYDDVDEFFPRNVQFISYKWRKMAPEILAAARRGECRVLLECPAEYPGLEMGDEIYADSFKARSVVCSDWFGPELPECRILTQHNFVLREVNTAVKSHLVAARVAG
jgi:hypothetical protein